MLDRDPIVVADAGPLIRLAAAGLLDSMRLTNRKIVIVDRVEEEVCGDLSKPYAEEIAAWMSAMRDAIEHAETLEGIAIAALRNREMTPEAQDRLKRALRNSGERAIREFIETLSPQDTDEALVLYEDGAVPNLMAAATVPMTLLTTRAFIREIEDRGYNRDAIKALEAVPYSMKPAIRTVIEANSGPAERF